MPVAGLGLGLYKPSGKLLKSAVQRWSDRVSAAGGSIPSNTQQIISDYFEKPILLAGLRGRIKLCYLFVGSGINSQKVPYIGSVNATPVNCVNADFTATTGFTGNGTNKYLNLGVSPNGLGLAIDNLQLIVYGSNLGGAVTRGILGSTGPGAMRNLLYRENDQSYRSEFDANAGNVASVITGVAAGMVVAQSPSPGMQRVNLNGVNVAFDPNSGYRTGASSTGNLIALAYDNAGSIILQSPASLRFLAVTERMTDAELALLYQIVDQLQVRLSRSTTGSTAQSLIVTAPAPYQVFQRGGNGKADIQIQGYYSGLATTIEARWNGGAWSAIATVAGTGSWRGSLPAQSAGQGTLDVRAANNTGNVISKAYVGVGDVIWPCGQSNTAGMFTNLQGYSHPTLKASKFMKDRGWSEYSDQSAAYNGAGSIWGPVATLIMAYTGVPVAIVNCGIGSTALVNGPWNAVNGSAFDQAVYSFKQLGSNGVLCVVYHQGESDTTGVSRAAYNAALDAIAAAFQSQTGYAFKMVVAQIGTVNASTAPNIDAIRYAISDAWNDNPDVAWGPSFYDVVMTDGLHLTTDAQALMGAARWMRAIRKQVFKDPLSEGRGPRFLSASYAGTNIDIQLQDGVAPLVLGASPTIGWAVSDAGGAKTVSGVTLITGGLRVTVNSTLTGPVSVSLGSGNSGAGNTIKDSGAIAPYPIEPFSVTLA